jgi:hypothetical protein
MDIFETIRIIIIETNQRDLSDEETLSVMNRILILGEWQEIREGLLNILYENKKTLWNEAILYIFYFQNRGYIYESAKTIALLYDCMSIFDDIDSNLIWTITRNIKSLTYLSDYDPYNDPMVYEEMEKIQKIRKTKELGL